MGVSAQKEGSLLAPSFLHTHTTLWPRIPVPFLLDDAAGGLSDALMATGAVLEVVAGCVTRSGPEGWAWATSLVLWASSFGAACSFERDFPLTALGGLRR